MKQLPPNSQCQRILIVDNEPAVALVLQSGLEKLSHCEVMAAHSGEQALQLFERQSFGLLITDYKMPGIDGFRLAARVKQLYPQTLIMILAAYIDPAVYEQCDRTAVRRFLYKPVELNEFRREVSEVLQESYYD